jgi:hypothetical protein
MRHMIPNANATRVPFLPAVAAAGLAGSLLLALALALDRPGPAPRWEGPLDYVPERREYLPRCTLPIEADRAVALTLAGTASAPVRIRLHVRSDDGACLGEREIALDPGRDGRVGARVVVRSALRAPQTFVWQAASGTAEPLHLRIRGGSLLPVRPLGAAGGAFLLAGLIGWMGWRRRPQDGTRPRTGAGIARGALLGIALALGALAWAARDTSKLTLPLRASGPVEDP